MDNLFSPFGFCLRTFRLDHNPLQTSRQCQLSIQSSQHTKKTQLYLSGCVFSNEDLNSTLIITKFPNIFIDHIINDTWASGRTFQDMKSNGTRINRWNIINIQVRFTSIQHFRFFYWKTV